MAHHDHHDHDLTFQPDEEDSLGHYAIAEMAMRELLVEKGIIAADEFRSALEWYDRASPALGAKIIARAWTEPDFKSGLWSSRTKPSPNTASTWDTSTCTPWKTPHRCTT